MSPITAIGRVMTSSGASGAPSYRPTPPLPFARRWTSRINRRNALFVAVPMTSLFGYIDILTGEDVTVGFLYLLPIFIGTWFRRWLGGGLVLFVCLLFRAYNAIHTQLSPWNIAWNLAAESIAIAIAIYLTDIARAHEAAMVTKLVNATEQLRQAERLNTLGKLAAGVAHELGTPLNVLMGHAELLAEAEDDLARERRKALATTILDQGDRMEAIIRQLLTFGRRAGRGRTVTRLRAIAESTASSLRKLASKAKVRVEVEPREGVQGREDILAVVVATEIEQVLTNLIMNAIQASSPGGVVTIRLSRQGAFAAIRVIDHGCGIAEEHLPHVFDPFFTTKDVGAGTGLGLSVSYGIVSDHHGRIEVESHVGEGSTFTVLLPETDAVEERS